MSEQKSGFSIFHPVIRIEHREFYEAILNEISSISPVCNQARSTAAEISKDSAEEELIVDLIKKVEDFSNELLSVTKNLFDQFYQTKETFYQSMLKIITFNKINLLDRNLLERTCDVRWWAMDDAFAIAVEIYNKVSAGARDVQQTVLGLGEQFIDNREVHEAIEKIDKYLSSSIWLKNKSEDLDEFFENIDIIYSCLKEISRVNLKSKIDYFMKDVEICSRSSQHACARLKDIWTSYTLYSDLYVAGTDGCIIASADPEFRGEIVGKNIKKELWFSEALKLQDASQYYAQDIQKLGDGEGPDLIYSTGIREGKLSRGQICGVMGIKFDFSGESKLILNDFMPHDKNDEVQEGAYSLFTNSYGQIISSTDDKIYPVGDYLHLPRSHRSLEAGEKVCSYAVVEGKDSALVSAKTNGYLEYEGLGWCSHSIVPKSHIFEHEDDGLKIELSHKDMIESALIPEINKKTYDRIQEYKESIQLISLNGIVFASKLGKRGAALGPIFDRITKTGDFATNRMEELLLEMARDEFAQNGEALQTISKQAMDLIDRNLFERIADIRWWTTDDCLSQALEFPSEDNLNAAVDRLKVIHNSYAMYRNLVLCNASGKIIGTSRAETGTELKQLDVASEDWFLGAMRTSSLDQYGVSDVKHSPLERNKETSLIYSGGIRFKSNSEGEAKGVLAILFDWDTEAKKILRSCLQKDRNGHAIEGCHCFYTNNKGKIIESTDLDVFKNGVKLPLTDQHKNLTPGYSCSGIIVFKDKRYLLGSTCSKGYRGYDGLGWVAHVIRPV